MEGVARDHVEKNTIFEMVVHVNMSEERMVWKIILRLIGNSGTAVFYE